MGFRFRKSVKIAKGVRVNFNKKSVGVSLGGKGAKISINSSGRKSATVGIPGTGLSYTKNLNDKKTKSSGSAIPDIDTSEYSAKPAPSQPWYRAYVKSYISGAIFIGIWRILSSSLQTVSIISLLIGIIMLIRGIAGHKISSGTPKSQDKILNAPDIPMEIIQSVLVPGSTEAVSWNQLVAAAQTQAPQWEKILTDSRQLIHETVNPEVFFSRYDLILDVLQKLSVAEKVVEISWSPSSELNAVYNNQEAEISSFIDRSYQQMKVKAASLKTERGKRNRKIHYYQSMLPYEKAKPYIFPMMESDGIDLSECEVS